MRPYSKRDMKRPGIIANYRISRGRRDRRLVENVLMAQRGAGGRAERHLEDE